MASSNRNLIQSDTPSLFREKPKRKFHGMKKFPEYSIWLSLKDRCLNPKNEHYAYYGGRGIRVCDSWRYSFPSFIADMGRRPKGETIDRSDNNGHYSCGKCGHCIAAGWTANCRLATRLEQSRNKSNSRFLTHDGETRHISEWSEITGIPRRLIQNRVDKFGWTVSDALTVKVGITIRIRAIKYEFQGQMLTIGELSKICGIPQQLLSHRLLESKWPLARAMGEPVNERSGIAKYEYHGTTITSGEISKRCGLSQSTVIGRLNRGWGVEQILNAPFRSHKSLNLGKKQQPVEKS